MKEKHPPGIPPDVLAWMEGRVRERGPIPMIERIFLHGRDYHECALRCLELRSDGQTFLFRPSLVLLAFVIEIYLKGLLAHNGKPTYGHKLDELFDKLEDEMQEKVAGRYAARHHDRALRADLQGYSDLFVKMRYSYEIEGPRTDDISGVAQLASALYETCAELWPRLVRADLVHDRILAPNQGVPIVAE